MEHTELEPTRSVPGGQGGNGGEDWLADVGDVDWDDANAPTGERAARRGSGGFDASGGTGDEHDAAIQRRRLIAAIVAVVVVGLAIAIPVIAFGGGGSSKEPPPATTTPPVTTTPAATTPTTTTPATTTPAAPVAKVEVPAGTLLKPGSSGAEVKQLQKALKSLGHDPGAVDGDYGPKTQAAVSEFQTAKKISADGVVGPETLTALNTALAAQSTAG